MKTPFAWDNYSDQPYQLKDRTFKKAMRKKELSSLLYTIFSSQFVLPFAFLIQFFIPKRKLSTDNFFGMSVNLDKAPLESVTLIDELGVDALLIRLPLWEMDRVDTYIDFVKTFKDKKILLNIMQDREHIEDLELLQKDLSLIFTRFSPYVEQFQVGTTINRAKWGFFSIREYLKFYKVAYQLKQKNFSKLQLLGPSVIDFEYHFTVHALFNFFKLRYDGISALLYVDRRGAPENRQMGLDLIKKIDLLDALAFLSPKSKRRVYITETNWPISNTAPYAPTSEHECVSEEDYANFMVRYYLLAFASQKIDRVYWHQLIAPGYGLIDKREGLRRRTAFRAFSNMLKLLKNMQFVSLKTDGGIYRLIVQNSRQTVTVIWSQDLEQISYDTVQTYYDRDGQELEAKEIQVGPSPIYITEAN